mgnify:FL=1
MGFFDKLFGGKTEQEETVKFFGQSKTVLTPIRGKVLAQADIPDETFAQGILGPGCGIEPPARPCMLRLTAPWNRWLPPCTPWA